MHEFSFAFTSRNAHGPVPDNKCGNNHCPISIDSICHIIPEKKGKKKKTFLAPLFSHNPVESEPVPWRRRKIPGRDQCTSQTYANCPGTVDANLTSVRRPEYVEDVEP